MTNKTKKTTQSKKMYLVITEDDARDFFGTWAEAEDHAITMCDRDGLESRIFEISKVWNVVQPPEPESEVNETNFDELLDEG